MSLKPFVIIALAISLAACTQHEKMESMKHEHADAPPATIPADAIDLKNTVCPVTGDLVGDCKLFEVYKGKVYHFCCDDCPMDFKINPEKYVKLVADNPAKYGVKTAP